MIAPKHYLLVGEAPPPGTIATPWHRHFAARIVCRALDIESRRRLGRELSWAGNANQRAANRLLTRFISSCEHVNLLSRWPGYDRRGSAFPLAAARRSAERIKADPSLPFVILAGRRVARAFGFGHLVADELGYFESYWSPGESGDPVTYMVVPHPSGVNRWWNDPGNRARALVHLRALGRLAIARQGGLGQSTT